MTSFFILLTTIFPYKYSGLRMTVEIFKYLRAIYDDFLEKILGKL